MEILLFFFTGTNDAFWLEYVWICPHIQFLHVTVEAEFLRHAATIKLFEDVLAVINIFLLACHTGL